MASEYESSSVNLDIKLELSGLERTFRRLIRSMAEFTMDQRVQARIRARTLARFQVVHAAAGVRLAKSTIKNGRRRHGIVKHRRDMLRAVRKAELRWLP